jgi:hypothetical protein
MPNRNAEALADLALVDVLAVALARGACEQQDPVSAERLQRILDRVDRIGLGVSGRGSLATR